MLTTKNFSPNQTLKKIDQTLELTHEIIDNLTPKGLDELMSGYGHDLDKMLNGVSSEAYEVLYGSGQKEIKEHSEQYLRGLNESFEETLRVNDAAYFATSVLSGVQISSHHLEWSELVRNRRRFAVLASRDSGKSFFFSVINILWKLYCFDANSKIIRRRYKKGFLFAHTSSKAEDYLEQVKEFIETNDMLTDKLYNPRYWNKAEIQCKNGASVKARGFFSSVRGYHPHYIMVDDPLTDKIIYSKVQRQKSITYFYSVIMNMIVPKGQVGVVGTPFMSDDLYSTFRNREKLKIWTYREYPVIFPDGSLLWPDRYDFETVMEKRKDNGHLIFSREFMLKPIVSDVSIFPMEILQNAITGDAMKHVLVPTIDSSPKKFVHVVVGCDFSISADVDSDRTVFMVFGLTENMEMWLLHVWASATARYHEQIQRLKIINQNFRPDIVVAEANNFQRIYAESFPDDDIPIVPHTTGTNKNDLRDGLPSLAIFFERGKIKFPRGNEQSRKRTDIIINEFTNISFTDKGLQAVDGHDDYPMAMWQAKVGVDMIRKHYG